MQLERKRKQFEERGVRVAAISYDSVEVLEVAGEDYALQDVAGYSASVFTPIRGR